MGQLPPWLDPKTYTRQHQNRRSGRQEARRAAETGGKVQPGSGSSWRRPEDVQTPAHLEQLKYTDEASFKINVSELSGLFANAMRDGREPRLVIEFSRYHLRMVAEIEEVR